MRALIGVAALCVWGLSIATGLGDGKVFGRSEVQARVTIPNQQALISHQAGTECLVIETAFLGRGTNFGWVVPLPGEPRVTAVSEDFFPALRTAFQPRLLHYVHHYYLGVLFAGGVAFLAWRSFKGEAVWWKDLPLCLVLALALGILGKNLLLSGPGLVFLLATRLLVRSTVNFTVVVLVGMLLAVGMTAALHMKQSGLLITMEAGGDPSLATPLGVTVLSVQRAGVFEVTTLRGANPRAVLDWLEHNGFAAPAAIGPVVEDYVARGWVFVASKIRREHTTDGVTSAHPLSFTFSTPQPIYPLRLTGVDNEACAIDLYVFGERRATASPFRVLRCDRVANNSPDVSDRPRQSRLQIRNSEVLHCIGHATVGTQLSALLTPEQMRADAEIRWRAFSSRGGTVFSRSGAAIVALNVSVPLAMLGWLLVGASRDGWGVNEKFIAQWRLAVIIAALVTGCGVYWLLPKVDVLNLPAVTEV